jgi:hypothetical protein
MALSKEKLVTLNKHKQNVLNKLSSPIPPKHKNRPNEYLNFLKKELELVEATLKKDQGL